MQLSKLENQAYEELKKNELYLFKIKDLCLLLNIKRARAYNLVKALKKKGAIKKAGKSFLAFREANERVIGQTLHYPVYLSFWSALSYYGFSDQRPTKSFFATTKYCREIWPFRYITLSKSRFFGYTLLEGITIAEKEKALLDSLLLPKYAGGMKEVTKSFQAAKGQLNLKKLLEYAFKMKSKAVLRRLGFILEKEKYPDKLLKKIKKQIGKGYEKLDPSLKRKGNLNKPWGLDINY